MRARGPRTRVRVTRLLADAVHGIRSQPTRSILTCLGTVVGVGAMVTILGLAATANGQIEETFSAQSSTLVTAELSGAGGSRFPADAVADVAAIEGVRNVAIVSSITSVPPRVHPGEPDPGKEPPRVSGVTPDYWTAVEAPLLQGRLIDESLADRPVAVLGERTAMRLGITDVADQVLIDVQGQDFLVIGIVGPARRDQVSAGDIAISQDYVRGWLPKGDYIEQMLVTTRLGAGETTARQLPTAVDPFRPDRFVAHYPTRPRVVDDAVSADLQRLFVLLAIVTMIVGAIGIANVALMSVMERRREIGLRRALGARSRHIVAQFLFESAILGALGGAAGGALGQFVVIGVSIARDWTPTLDPLVTVAAAPLGLLVGVLAGLYPALRAARLPPMTALRSS
jgi:putative ABC transport system permease protein